MKNTPVMSLDIEIILVIRGQCISHFISVVTDCNKFLYSISLFMLRILQSRDMNNHVLPPLDPFIAEYIKLQSEPDESGKRIILCSGEVAAIDFHAVDLFDGETDKKFRNRYCFRGPIYFKSRNQYSFWKAFSDSSSEDDENGSKSIDKNEDSDYEKKLEKLYALEMVNIHNDTGNTDKDDDPYPSKEEKDSTVDVCYEDVNESDFEYDNSADDELTDEELEQKESMPQNSDVEDDDVFYTNDERNGENLNTWT